MSQLSWRSFEHRLPKLAERTIRRYVETSPHYRGKAPAHLHQHMAHTVREFGRMFSRAAREGDGPREDELELFRQRGRERGAEGLPVGEFVHAYLLVAEEMWAEVDDLSGGSPPDGAAAVLLKCTHRVMNAAVQAHQKEFQTADHEQREAARALVRRLAAGESIPEPADVRLAPAYGVLALRFAVDPADSVGDAVGRHLAGQRKVRLLLQHLRRELSGDVLAALDPDGGLLLLPSGSDNAEAVLDEARLAVPRAHQTTGVEITGAFAHAAELSEIPAAVAEAERLLRLNAVPDTVAVLADHLFEYQLNHDSAATPQLRALAARLDGEPDLTTTLRTYFETDFNRRETARKLHVHPNTVDNRLSRIANLTGADPRTAKGLLLLGASLGLTG
ncbi:PucR family transcriptional regulator [Amycolatopsis nivea]|uniref:PucR family transcriptional regulator n=1 Tax=Amycolatopsis nivea TaxID=1644109 RepID=UPI00106F867D|nr:helix-turn-helix domain-containing protein [Amycolatopsis nivea]